MLNIRKLFMVALLSVSCLPVSDYILAAEREGVVWIDVRTAREFRQGHIEGAINIPHGDIGHKIFESVSDTFVEVHLYDGSQGTFAGLALELLMEMGFQDVHNEGGYEQLLQQQALDSASEQ